MSVQFERDERKFDFHDIGLAIKRAREAKGMTQEQLACIIDRDPRTVMYNENDGQHPISAALFCTVLLRTALEGLFSKLALGKGPLCFMPGFAT